MEMEAMKPNRHDYIEIKYEQNPTFQTNSI